MGIGRVVRVLLAAAVLPVFAGVAVNAATDTPFPGLLNVIQRYPWQSLLIALIASGLVAWWELRDRSAGSAPLTEGEQARLRRRLLDETRRIWVDGLLARSLQGTVRLDLNLVARQEKVTHPVHALSPPAAPDPYTDRGELFAAAGERLLILGAPGAGKTTLLLELAADLAVRAENDATAHVPVVLNLATWPDDPKTFDDWVVGELRRYHDVPPRAA